MNPADVLERAADLIEANGLAKGILKDDKGRHCAMGAILTVLDGRCDASIGATIDALVATLPEYCPLFHAPEIWSPVVLWNNDVDRTEVEVVEAFRQAAKNVRNEAVPAASPT